MKRIWQWLKDSNRLKHLLLGVVLVLLVLWNLKITNWEESPIG